MKTLIACLLTIASLYCYAQQKVPTACEVQNTLPGSVSVLKEHAKEVIRQSHDSCVLRLMDTLIHRFTLTDNVIYLDGLEYISKISDGYVSEYLSDILDHAFEGHFAALLDYLYRHPESSLREWQVSAWSWTLRAMGDTKGRAYIDGVIGKQINLKKLPAGKKSYLDKMKSEIDGKMFD